MNFADAITRLTELLPGIENEEFSWASVAALLVKRYQGNEKNGSSALQLTDSRETPTADSKTEGFFPSLTVNDVFKFERLKIPLRVHTSNVSALQEGASDSGEPPRFEDDKLYVRRRPPLNDGRNPSIQLTGGPTLIRPLLEADDVFVFIRKTGTPAVYAFGLRANQVRDSELDVSSHATAVSENSDLTGRQIEYDFSQLAAGTEADDLDGEGENEGLSSDGGSVVLATPFLLLAGISGTGKTRFVREQARLSAGRATPEPPLNYELICVRPDWHEPSDLLGYVTRLAGERFVVTPFLRFVVKAWRDAVAEPSTLALKPLDQITSFWLCLDEMNLAPVEQYFADFLSIVETRRWESGVYTCDPILPVPKIGLSTSALETLGKDLGFEVGDALWKRFSEHGIPVPPNLIVVGTVNMDETTHGFSRKVIDRALTFDFGAFFPNDFDAYFVPKVANARLQFPRWASVTEADLIGVAADSGGARSTDFLNHVNAVLAGTPFQLAFRALNGLLVSLRAFAPNSDAALRAIWDDFVMTKVLPRIEGDAEKLKLNAIGTDHVSLLTRLSETLAAHGLAKSEMRPDLYRRNGDAPIDVAMRSAEALERMQDRLLSHGFTSFWP
jgi:hypothetical protein